ncbi:MAG: PASTA domain-containing protein [Nitrospirae bacterium]|nr:MAG: PASTA domain-containing protein [Nitrospirota bacterium]
MKRLFNISVYLIVFFLLTGAGSYLTIRFLGTKKTIPVPDLTGKDILEANRIVLENRLYLKIDGEEFSTEIPSGKIIRQDIPPGEQIKEGRTIRVIMSKGPQHYYMPDFTGMTLDEARELAAEKQIKISRVIEVNSDTYERGIVISQRPSSEERGSGKVKLLVSLGPYPVEYICPDFRGLTVQDAKALAEKLGIEVSLEGYGSRIKSQSPSPGQIIKKGDTLKLELEYKEEEQLKWL